MSHAASSSAEPLPRGPIGLLADHTFGPFFFGKMFATAGMWVQNIAAAILVFELTGSSVLVGAVSIAQFGPQVLIAPLSGARADRSADRRRQMVLGRVVTGAGSALLALTLWLGDPRGLAGAAAVIAAAAVVGVGFAIGGPAMQSVLPSLVRPRELPTAIALDAIPFTFARAAGPAAGALIVASLGSAPAFAIAAATALGYAVVLSLIEVRAAPRTQPTDGSVRHGVRYLRVDRTLPLLLFGVAAVGVGADPVITLTPAIADELGGGAQLVGRLASSFGAGAGGAFLLLAPARRRMGLAMVGCAGVGIMALGTVALAASMTAAAAMAALAVSGAGLMAAFTSLSTQIQQRVPEELRGRVMALWAVAFLGSRPFAAAMNGIIAEAVSVSTALAVVAVILAAAAAVVRPGRVLVPAPSEGP